MPVNIHILNSTGILNQQLDEIRAAFKASKNNALKILKLQNVDVIVRYNPVYAIDELGVGGFSDSINSTIYISIGTKRHISANAIKACMEHEFYHIKRHTIMGIPKTLRDCTIDEGLACLYEYENNNNIPIYAKQKIEAKYINKFLGHLNDTENIDRWFFGSKDIPRWFGYSYGFKLVNEYIDKHKTNAYGLLEINASEI